MCCALHDDEAKIERRKLRAVDPSAWVPIPSSCMPNDAVHGQAVPASCRHRGIMAVGDVTSFLLMLRIAALTQLTRHTRNAMLGFLSQNKAERTKRQRRATCRESVQRSVHVSEPHGRGRRRGRHHEFKTVTLFCVYDLSAHNCVTPRTHAQRYAGQQVCEVGSAHLYKKLSAACKIVHVERRLRVNHLHDVYTGQSSCS